MPDSTQSDRDDVRDDLLKEAMRIILEHAHNARNDAEEDEEAVAIIAITPIYTGDNVIYPEEPFGSSALIKIFDEIRNCGRDIVDFTQRIINRGEDICLSVDVVSIRYGGVISTEGLFTLKDSLTSNRKYAFALRVRWPGKQS